MRFATIALAFALTGSTALSEDSKPPKGTFAASVSVPMLCGDYESLYEQLKSMNMSDIMISSDPITDDTLIVFHFDRKEAKMAITQWTSDMKMGCIAFLGEHSIANKSALKLLDPNGPAL